MISGCSAVEDDGTWQVKVKVTGRSVVTTLQCILRRLERADCRGGIGIGFVMRTIREQIVFAKPGGLYSIEAAMTGI